MDDTGQQILVEWKKRMNALVYGSRLKEREGDGLREVKNTEEEENSGFRVDSCPHRPSISTSIQCSNLFSKYYIALYPEKPVSS